MRLPWLIAFHLAGASSDADAISLTTDSSVSDMLVPVSPSGTG